MCIIRVKYTILAVRVIARRTLKDFSEPLRGSKDYKAVKGAKNSEEKQMSANKRVSLCLGIMAVMGWFANCARAQAQEPTWPQQFQILAGESTTFGFVVTQPGTITVNVNFQGAPLVVSLSGPLAQPLQQQGSGALQLQYQATAADVQRSYFWQVRMAPANTAAPAPYQLPQVLASGAISVQHPAANMTLAASAIAQKTQAQQSAMTAAAAKVKATPIAAAPAPPPSTFGTGIRTVSSLRGPSATTPAVPPATLQTLQQKVLGQQAPLPRTAVNGAVIPAGTHATPVPQSGVAYLTPGKGLTITPLNNPGTVSLAPPVINPGQSYTNVVMMPASNGTFPDWFIYGSNFGSQPGQLHFVFPGNNIVVPTYQWTSQSVAFQLPELLFDQATSVQVYLVNSQGRSSNAVTYQYAPLPPQLSTYITCNETGAVMPWCDLWMVGSYWGTTPGQLHFVNSNGTDNIVSTSAWLDTSTSAWLGSDAPPNAPNTDFSYLVTSGTPIYQFTGFSGQVYIKRGASVSNRVNLQLGPWDYATATLPLSQSGMASPWDSILWPWDMSHSSDFFSGHKGTDQFFQGQPLKNGWVVDSVNFSIDPTCISAGLWGSEGAYLTQTPVAATTNPATSVNWWVDASNNEICYKLSVNVRGPGEVPYW